MVVAFAGSRSLPSVALPGGLVSRVVGSVVASGRVVAVGDAVGADAAVLSARLALPFLSSSSRSLLLVFAVGGASGSAGVPPSLAPAALSGFWAGSAVSAVCAAASLARSPGHGCVAPVAVSWWAGGGPAVPLRSRLAARSAACVAAAAAGSVCGSGFVAFVAAGSRSVGTWRSVRLAAAAGLPVVVFPVGGAVPLPSLAPGGSWVVAGGGVWRLGWSWRPSAGCLVRVGG